jgi:hypothetical protein
MAEERIRTTTPLWPDYENDDRFLGLPAELPSGHSRFAIEPCSGYGDLSFAPAMRQNGRPKEGSVAVTPDERNAWRRVMQQALGHVMDVPLVDER